MTHPKIMESITTVVCLMHSTLRIAGTLGHFESMVYVGCLMICTAKVLFLHSEWVTSCHLCGNLGLDEGESLGAVLVNILLVSVGVIAVAAVWVSSVAVRLDDACVGRRALEASGARGKLQGLSVSLSAMLSGSLTPPALHVPTL